MSDPTIDPTETEIRRWLLDYAWSGSAAEQEREVDCIMAQGHWRHVDVVADRFAGAQEEAGPVAFGNGLEFALSALYECHEGPHLFGCPSGNGEGGLL